MHDFFHQQYHQVPLKIEKVKLKGHCRKALPLPAPPGRPFPFQDHVFSNRSVRRKKHIEFHEKPSRKSIQTHLQYREFFISVKCSTGWWFWILFIFTPIRGNDPIWLIFLRWVVQPPTSSMFPTKTRLPSIVSCCKQSATGGPGPQRSFSSFQSGFSGEHLGSGVSRKMGAVMYCWKSKPPIYDRNLCFYSYWIFV